MSEIFALLVFILSFILPIAGDFWYIKEIRKNNCQDFSEDLRQECFKILNKKNNNLK